MILASESSAQSNPAAQSAQPQQQQSAPATAPVVQQKVPEPDYYTTDCQRPKDHEAADLCEQRRQAQAAEDNVWWVRFQTYLGIFGAILVLCSLWFTGWAAIAAARAAKAADASVRVASDTAKRQLRAYVSGTDSTLNDFKIGERPAGHITMKNNGQTPAYNTRSVVSLTLATAPTTDFNIVTDGISTSAVGPECTFHPSDQLDEPLTQAHMDDFFSGKKELFFFGRITYRDAFEKDRETNFRFFLDPYNARRNNIVWTVAPEGNDAT